MADTIKYDFFVRNVVEGEEAAYMAIIPAFNNAVVFGSDLNELEEGMKLTIESEIEELKKNKKPIPKPDRKSQFSGKLIIRIEPALHEKLSIEAKANSTSLNRYIEDKLGR